MKTELLWGTGNPNKHNYAKDIRCINESCERYNQNNETLIGKIIEESTGVKKSPFQNTPEEKYALIFSCPVCNTKYWGHITEKQAENVEKIRDVMNNHPLKRTNNLA